MNKLSVPLVAAIDATGVDAHGSALRMLPPLAQKRVQILPNPLAVDRPPEHAMIQNEQVSLAVAHDRAFEAIVLTIDARRDPQNLIGQAIEAEGFPASEEFMLVEVIAFGAPGFAEDQVCEGLQRVWAALRLQEFGRQLSPAGIVVRADKRVDPETRVPLHVRRRRPPPAGRDHRRLVPFADE